MVGLLGFVNVWFFFVIVFLMVFVVFIGVKMVYWFDRIILRCMFVFIMVVIVMKMILDVF